MASLTSEQKQRMEQNRIRALKIRELKNQNTVEENSALLKRSFSHAAYLPDRPSSSISITSKESGVDSHLAGLQPGKSGLLKNRKNWKIGKQENWKAVPQNKPVGQFLRSKTSALQTAVGTVSQFGTTESGLKKHMHGCSANQLSKSISSGRLIFTKPVTQFYKKPQGGGVSMAKETAKDHVPDASDGLSTSLTQLSKKLQFPPSGKSTCNDAQTHCSSTASISQTDLTSKPSKIFGQKQSFTGTFVLVSKDRFQVNLPFRQDIIECFHKMESRNYDASQRRWTFAVTEYNSLMKHIRSLQPHVELNPLPAPVVKLFCRHSASTYAIQEANLGSIDQKLQDGLLPFQREGVNFVIHHGGRALIADDMGLGKTIQAICVACYYRTEWPLLVVSPSSMRYSWAEAFEKWVPSLNQEDIHVVGSGQRKKDFGLITIISYDLMSRRSKELAAQMYQVVIMDESHFLKNYKTARTKSAMLIMKNAPRRLLLTGTPALSRPSELYMQIQALHSSMFPSFHEFALRYCDAKQNAWGWDYSGSSNLCELQLLLERKVMIRRLKSDVLSQLPPKTRRKIIMDPKSIKANNFALKSLAVAAKKEKANRDMILAYYAETARLKIHAVSMYMEDLLEGEKKIIVFAHHQDMLDALCEACEKKKVGYIRIDGSTPPQQRFKFCDDFQMKDEYRVAVLSILAANSGITLTAASLVIFAELFWNPGILMQAEDRAHRIGQSDAVFIHYLIAKGTADDLLWPLIQRKLVTLEKAGLSKNDFSEADTKLMKDPTQQSIMDFLEQSFSEELSQEELQALDETETREETNEGRKSRLHPETSLQVKERKMKRDTRADQSFPMENLLSSNLRKSSSQPCKKLKTDSR